MGEFDITDVIDGIKEFCSDVVEKVVNFFKGLFSNEEQQDDTETFTEEECKNGVSETEVSDDTECTCDACVICTNATEDSIPIHLKKDGVLIHLSGIGRLNKMDIELDGHFLGCVKGGECSVDKDSIEGGMWQEVDDGNDEGEDKEILNRDKSYMICTKNEGIIYFYDDGQKVLECIEEIVADIGKMHISDQGIEMIINFELSGETAKAWGIGEVDENGEVIGIYPHYVFKTENGNYISDGGITFGYGHWVSQDSYNTEIEQKNLVDKYAPGVSFVPPYIPDNGVSYKVSGSTYMPIDEAKNLFRSDLQGAETALNEFLAANSIQLEQNQFDALISFTHQYGAGWWKKEDKKMPTFIREGKGEYDAEEVRNVFKLHDDEKRRAAEAEVFINGYE